MEALTFLAGFGAALALSYRHQIKQYIKGKTVTFASAPPKGVRPSGALRPFTVSAKRKPRVNDDQKAWLAENNTTR
jgi:hypothetical protein